MYILKNKHMKRSIFIQLMLKVKTSPCISCNICPTIYANKNLSRFIYGRAPTKGSKLVVTRNRRIVSPLYFNRVEYKFHAFDHVVAWLFDVYILQLQIKERRKKFCARFALCALNRFFLYRDSLQSTQSLIINYLRI